MTKLAGVVRQLKKDKESVKLLTKPAFTKWLKVNKNLKFVQQSNSKCPLAVFSQKDVTLTGNDKKCLIGTAPGPKWATAFIRKYDDGNDASGKAALAILAKLK